MPGPGSQFHDKKSAKIYKEEERDLVIMLQKDEKKRSNTTKAERVISFLNFKGMNPAVGPGSYPVKEKKIEEKGKKYKEYQKILKEKKEKEREKVKADEEKARDIREKIGESKVPKFPEPIPADRVTFDKYQKMYGSDKDRMKAKASKAKGRLKVMAGKGFGGSQRFDRNELDKWKSEVEKYNAVVTDGKQLDPKLDKTPGPAAYCLINGWQGKKTKIKKLNDNQFPSIFKRVSHGPQINMYYSQ